MVVLNSFTQPTGGIRHQQNNTTVYVNDNNLGKGTLYIAESYLSWVSSAGDGFSIEYPHISLHAVSRDLSAFPQECLFLMLDTALGGEEIGNGDWEDDDEKENGSTDEGTTELRLVPDDRGMLDAMYHAMNACQALHPDPGDSFSDEDIYEDADDELPVEEADSRMAGLRIETMDGTFHMNRSGERATSRTLDTSVEEGTLDTSGYSYSVHRSGTFESVGNRVVGGLGHYRAGDVEDVGGEIPGRLPDGHIVDRFGDVEEGEDVEGEEEGDVEEGGGYGN